MVRFIAAALVGLAFCGLTATHSIAGDGIIYFHPAYFYPAHPYHVLYPAEVAPYLGSVRRPRVLGVKGPRIAMSPERFHSYPYVSTFDGCFRWQRHGWRWHRIFVCG